MLSEKKIPNRLINETSPYLLQHAHNPVNWYPWGEEAFEKAKAEDKPVFLSIGYSTCHWCHVMEHESFESEAVAQRLNQDFIAIKVDKEERPDIDSIYMRVCQAYTGGGGWPTSIFMSPEQKPFYAGTYFPPRNFMGLLDSVSENWHNNRAKLLESGDDIVRMLSDDRSDVNRRDDDKKDLPSLAYDIFRRSFDKEYGGFGNAPKFPSPHNLMFLLGYAKQTGENHALEMVEKTLIQMYKGGIFDHIGFGFSRYSTDKYWLAPHFEKMLYDNALLATAYVLAYEQTQNKLYKSIAEKIFIYIEREMSNGEGGFYSAQDADSDGVEGKYYVFTPEEVVDVLGEKDGKSFCDNFDITKKGNFEGHNIPNLIKQKPPFNTMDDCLDRLYDYRLSRAQLHKDIKVLTAWNSLMLWTYANAYRVFKDEKHLKTARALYEFIERELVDETTLYVSITDKKRSGKGFIDDYAYYILALIGMYEACYDEKYLERALKLNEKTLSHFYDYDNGGFYFNGKDNEQLIMRPKESYDGAMPSGNSVMAYNLDRLSKLTKNEELYKLSESQQKYMSGVSDDYPAGFSFFLLSLLPTRDIVCVLKEGEDVQVPCDLCTVVRVLKQSTREFTLLNDRTTYYVCEGNRCLPPKNEL